MWDYKFYFHSIVFCFSSETNQPNPAFVFVDFSQNELKPHWTANFALFYYIHTTYLVGN